MKTLILFVSLLTCANRAYTQDSLGYGLKLPTETELKKIPYIPQFSLPQYVVLPSRVDLSHLMPPVGDQGGQGSCTAFAVSYAFKSYQEKTQYDWVFVEGGINRNDRICSPSFVYNVSKQMVGNMNCADGISFGQAFKVLKDYGTSFLSDFSYSESNCSLIPSQINFVNASTNKISDFSQVGHKNINEIKYNLSVGNPVVVGVLLDRSFQPDGFDAYKNKKRYTYVRKSFLDPNLYHAMLCVGYDDRSGTFQLMNSWGDKWGNAGYVDIPYELIDDVFNEAYTMYDAYRTSLFVTIDKKEVGKKYSVTNSDSSKFSSWFEEGHYREFKGIRFGLTFLDVDNKSASVVFTDTSKKEINTVKYKVNEPQTFYHGDQRIAFTLKEIGKEGGKAFAKAAFFEIAIDESVDKVVVERFKTLLMLVEQKELLKKVSLLEEEIIKN